MHMNNQTLQNPTKLGEAPASTRKLERILRNLQEFCFANNTIINPLDASIPSLGKPLTPSTAPSNPDMPSIRQVPHTSVCNCQRFGPQVVHKPRQLPMSC